MGDLLSRFDNVQLFLLVPILGGLLCGVIGILAGAWLKLRQAEIDAKLKIDMLNRGMSAEQIQTVIEAGSRGRMTAAILHGTGQCGEHAAES